MTNKEKWVNSDEVMSYMFRKKPKLDNSFDIEVFNNYFNNSYNKDESGALINVNEVIEKDKYNRKKYIDILQGFRMIPVFTLLVQSYDKNFTGYKGEDYNFNLPGSELMNPEMYNKEVIDKAVMSVIILETCKIHELVIGKQNKDLIYVIRNKRLAHHDIKTDYELTRAYKKYSLELICCILCIDIMFIKALPLSSIYGYRFRNENGIIETASLFYQINDTLKRIYERHNNKIYGENNYVNFETVVYRFLTYLDKKQAEIYLEHG